MSKLESNIECAETLMLVGFVSINTNNQEITTAGTIGIAYLPADRRYIVAFERIHPCTMYHGTIVHTHPLDHHWHIQDMQGRIVSCGKEIGAKAGLAIASFFLSRNKIAELTLPASVKSSVGKRKFVEAHAQTNLHAKGKGEAKTAKPMPITDSRKDPVMAPIPNANVAGYNYPNSTVATTVKSMDTGKNVYISTFHDLGLANVEYCGQYTWIYFPSKPSDAVRDTLKRQGYIARSRNGQVAWMLTSIADENSILDIVTMP